MSAFGNTCQKTFINCPQIAHALWVVFPTKPEYSLYVLVYKQSLSLHTSGIYPQFTLFFHITLLLIHIFSDIQLLGMKTAALFLHRQPFIVKHTIDRIL